MLSVKPNANFTQPLRVRAVRDEHLRALTLQLEGVGRQSAKEAATHSRSRPHGTPEGSA